MILRNIVQFIILITFYIMFIKQINFLIDGVGWVAWNGLFLWFAFVLLVLIPKYWKVDIKKKEVENVKDLHNTDWLDEVIEPE